MKLTIFCSPRRKKILPELVPLFDELFIESHAFFLTNGWDRSVVQNLREGMEYSDHILIIPEVSDFSSQSFAFIMGYAGNQRKHILLNLTDDPAWSTHRDIIEMFPLSADLIELQDQLEEILPVWERDIRNKTALNTLEPRLDDHAFEGLANSVATGDRFLAAVYLDAGYDINRESLHHVTLLGLAARNGYKELVSLLLEAGADPDGISSDRNNTPLMDAASEGYVEIVSYLIENGADLEVKSSNGQTAVVLAVGNKQNDCAALLLKAGADADSTDSLGLSARKYAALYGVTELLELMPSINTEE